jgi:hypothetical protein
MTSLVACGICHQGFLLYYLRYSKNGFLVCKDCYYKEDKELGKIDEIL